MQIIKFLLTYFYQKSDLSNRFLLLIFTIYAILLGITVYSHEPWMDEAQQWLLVSDLDLSTLFVNYLRYEGHPGLWYLILFIPAKLGLPYISVNIISACLAALGVWLFLRYSPFPLIIKILFPFTFFAFFQYGVVARSYCLIPPIIFLIAIKYKSKISNPYIYALLLSAFANISVYSFLIAGVLELLNIFDIFKNWRHLSKAAKFHQTGAFSVFCLSSLQIVIVLLTPPDQLLASSLKTDLTNFLIVGWRMLSGSLATDETGQLIWLPAVISGAVFVATLIFLRQKKLILLYLLPLILLLIFMALKYSNLWHQGILFFLWIFVLWIGFDEDRRKSYKFAAKIVLAGLTVVLAIQVSWSVYSVRYDLYQNYSGSLDVARFIKTNRLENSKIFASGWKSIAIAPYFKEKIFYNQNQDSKYRFWLWSVNNPSPVDFSQSVIESIKSEKPDVVIFACDHIDTNSAIEIKDYQAAEYFAGGICWKTGIYEPNSYQVFRKKQ